MERSRLALLFLFSAGLLSCLGCEDDTQAGDDDTISAPEPSPCDTGYRQDPDLPAEFLGDFPDGCVPQACGIGRWGDLEVDGETVYVDALAIEGGDGSEDAPFTRIQDGLDSAGGGGRLVAVATGTYVENLLMTEEHDGVLLAGRCRQLVEVDGREGAQHESGIRANGYYGDEQWWVSGISVTGARYAGISLENGSFYVEHTDVRENQFVGILAAGRTSVMRLADVEILSTTPISGGVAGRGINIQEGATLAATRCRVEGNVEYGVFATHAGTTLQLTDLIVRDTLPTAAGTKGRGIEVQDEASLVARRCLVEGNADAGIGAFGSETRVRLSDVVVRETQPIADGTAGRGIELEEGATLTAERCVVERNTEYGIFVSVDSRLSLSDVDVLQTQPRPDGTGGRGIEARDGSTVTAESCLVEGNTDYGIFVSDEGTSVHLSDVMVSDTRPLPDGTFGRGIEVQGGAAFEADGCVVERNADIGIFVGQPGTRALLADVEVSRTRRGALTTAAQGVACQNGAVLSASNVRVDQTEGLGLMASLGGWLACANCELSGNVFAGALVWDGAVLELSETSITGTTADANEGGGFGVYAQDRGSPCTLLVENTHIEDQPYAAVWLDGDGSYTIQTSTLVGGYGMELIYPDGSTVIQHGDGIVATGGVSASGAPFGLRFENNEIRDAVRAGVLLDGSAAVLSDNSFSGNTIDLIWQDCVGVEEPTGLDDVAVVDYCPTYDHHVAPLEFNLYLEEGQPLE